MFHNHMQVKYTEQVKEANSSSTQLFFFFFPPLELKNARIESEIFKNKDILIFRLLNLCLIG